MKLNIYFNGKELHPNEYRIDGDRLIIMDGEQEVVSHLLDNTKDGDSLFITSSTISDDELLKAIDESMPKMIFAGNAWRFIA